MKWNKVNENVGNKKILGVWYVVISEEIFSCSDNCLKIIMWLVCMHHACMWLLFVDYREKVLVLEPHLKTISIIIMQL